MISYNVRQKEKPDNLVAQGEIIHLFSLFILFLLFIIVELMEKHQPSSNKLFQHPILHEISHQAGYDFTFLKQ